MNKKASTTSGALRMAKQYLWNGEGSWDSFTRDPDKQTYICDSLSHAHYDGCVTYKAKTKAVKLIMTRLGPCVSVGQWLQVNVGYRVKFGVGHSAYYKQVQAYRHRWLDALIKEHEAMGD